MNKKEAVKKFRDAVYEAGKVLEELAGLGRLGAGGKPASVAEARELRNEFADEGAEFVERAWISFDPQPGKAELEAAVDKDEADAGGDGNDPGDETSGDETSGDAASTAGDNVPNEDPTVPGMDTAVIAAEERKRSDAEGGTPQ